MRTQIKRRKRQAVPTYRECAAIPTYLGKRRMIMKDWANYCDRRNS